MQTYALGGLAVGCLIWLFCRAWEQYETKPFATAVCISYEATTRPARNCLLRVCYSTCRVPNFLPQCTIILTLNLALAEDTLKQMQLMSSNPKFIMKSQNHMHNVSSL